MSARAATNLGTQPKFIAARHKASRRAGFQHRCGSERVALLAALDAAGYRVPATLPETFIAHCQSAGSGQSALIYLGRYLYRGVIREENILACDEHTVRFRYRDAQTGRYEQRELPGAEFLHLVLQHVLPKGFRRARNFGFLHPGFHMTWGKRLIALLHLVLKYLPPGAPQRKPRPPMLCPCCGAPMQIVRTRITRILAPPNLPGGALPV